MADTDTVGFLSADALNSTSTSNFHAEHVYLEGAVPVLPRVLGGNNMSNGGDGGCCACSMPATDRLWAVAFLGNVCITVLSAVYFENASTTTALEGDGHRRQLGYPGDWGRLEGGALVLFVAVLVLSVAVVVFATWGLAHGALFLLANIPELVLQAAYRGCIGFLAMVAIHGRNIDAAAAFALLLGYFVTRLLRGRVRFAGANLEVAAQAIKSVPWTIGVSLLMNVVHVVWAWTAVVAARGSIAALWTAVAPDGTVYPASECYDHTDFTVQENGPAISCWCDGTEISTGSHCAYGKQRSVLLCFWLVSALWGIAVLRNVLTATVSGSVASCWLSPRERWHVGGAFGRATQCSLGSLCKAAALTTVLRVITCPVRLFGCLRRVLCREQAAAGYGLPYAICVIAIHGVSFSEAASRANELVWQRGMEAAVADDAVVSIGLLLFGVWLLACFCVAMFTVSAVMLLDCLLADMAILVSTIPIAVLLWAIFEALVSSYKTVIFCFMEDPQTVRPNHDSRTYSNLLEAWQQMEIDCLGMARDAPSPIVSQIEPTEMSSFSTVPPNTQQLRAYGTPGVSEAHGPSSLA